MKLSGRNGSTLLWFVFLGMVIGSLGWEVVERVLSRFGIDLSLAVGPIGLNLAVVSFSLMVNPGTMFGILGSILLYRAI
jgi:hypothetical protein